MDSKGLPRPRASWCSWWKAIYVEDNALRLRICMSWRITDSKALEDAIFDLKSKAAKHIGVQQGMTVLDVGCGQGGFTAALAQIAGENGSVLAVDVSDEYLDEFIQRLDRYGVRNRVTFIQADGASLEGMVSDGVADMVVSFRLIEELKKREDMPKVIREMTRVASNGGRVCLTEMSTAARNRAEEVYIRLHKESGDCFFAPDEIVRGMEESGLEDVCVDKIDTDIWFSPELAKQDLSFAQVWYDTEVERNLGSLVDKHGMKYPEFLVFSGHKPGKE